MKAIMFIWLGIGTAQAISTEKFDSYDECMIARNSIVQYYKERFWEITCIPYEKHE